MREAWCKIRALFVRRRLSDDLREEIDAHLQMHLAGGSSRAAFGNTTRIGETAREQWSFPKLEGVARDLAYSLRMMRKNPVFAATAMLTLAIGIGGNTAIFTVVREVLLKPLEYPDPDRLVYVSMNSAKQEAHDLPFSLERLEYFRAGLQSLSALGAFLTSPENLTLSGTGEPEALTGARVSANFLDILGIQPILGRGFRADEDAAGGPAVAMVSERLWRRRFAADPALAGKTITLESIPYTVIGVLPAGFEFPLTGTDVWVTRPSEWSRFSASRYFRTGPFLSGLARLKPGVSLEQATAELEVRNQQYIAGHPGGVNMTVRLTPLKDRLVSNVRQMLWMLLGAVGFVLLISCANVASLMLARAAARSREFAVRAALGAARWRLIRQLLAESLVLSLTGGAIGVLLAVWSIKALTLADALSLSRRARPLSIPGSGRLEIDVTILLFSIGLSITAGVIFGLFPSVEASRPNLADVLRESGAGAGRSAGRRGALGWSPRGLLVVGQVALSIVLLIGAALLMRSFARLRGIDPGFQPANLLTLKIALPPARYNTDQKKAAFFNDLARRAGELPGVRAAAVAMSLPTTTIVRTDITKVEGQPDPDYTVPSNFATIESVTPGYFHALGIAVRRGREFTAQDNTKGAAPVMIINEHLARQFWPDYPRGIDPVGRHIAEGFDKSVDWFEIVGVVADTREGGLGEKVASEFYIPCTLHPPQTAFVAARTESDPMRFVNALRAQVWTLDPNQSVSEVKTMDALLEATMGQRRMTMMLLAAFAAVALLLAVIGIYGVIAYSVAQRTQEVGIRRALGAQYGDILRLVLGQALGLTIAGVAIGIGGAWWLTRLMSGLLFEVSPTDPTTFLAIALLFVAVALAAGYLPARRAARIDPMAALR